MGRVKQQLFLSVCVYACVIVARALEEAKHRAKWSRNSSRQKKKTPNHPANARKVKRRGVSVSTHTSFSCRPLPNNGNAESINRRRILSVARSFGRRAPLARASPYKKGKSSSRESRASRYKGSQRTNVKLVIHVEFLVILRDTEMRASPSLKSASLASQARRGKARFSRRWSKTGLVLRKGVKGRKGLKG